MKWWDRARRQRPSGARERVRLSGLPPSANGASSMHLWWETPRPGPFREARVVVEVVRQPQVARLYFWALQVSFVDHGRPVGAGHTGLQWHPGAPQGAVNWGGYADRQAGGGGGELPGSVAMLPPVDGPNTCHYPWQSGRPYRLRVWSPDPGAWRAEITDLAAAETTVVRDLWAGADALASPVVWSEVFARCDDPPTEVRWSALEVVPASGEVLPVLSVRPTYQSHREGGCANTESQAGAGYFAQFTGLADAGGRQTGSLTLTP